MKRSPTLIISQAFMPRKFLVGMSYVLANYVSELVGGLLGLIPTKYQLNNTLCSVGSNQKAIGIKHKNSHSTIKWLWRVKELFHIKRFNDVWG